MSGGPSAGPPTRAGGRPSQVGDLVAGVTVALVLIPQSIVYAELVGAPPERGLYVAAFAAIAAAPFASSPYLQTGPVGVTALLALGAAAGLAPAGTAEYVGTLTLLAFVVGLVRVAVGLMRLGGVAYLMSQPVLAGFTPAAALTLIATQIPAAFGADDEKGGIMQAAGSVLVHPDHWNASAIALAAGALVVMLGGRRVHPLFPGVLLAVAGGVILAGSGLYDGTTIGEIKAGLPDVTLDLPWEHFAELVVPGVVIAIVGFAEASTIARTYAAAERSVWDANQEFVSQGVANIAAGVVGGFPVGGSLSRSALNRYAGARTRWAGAITGVCVLAFFPFVGVMEDLPRAVLGAVIIGAVVGLVQFQPIFELRRYSRVQFGVAASTFLLTLMLAPRVQLAVVIGVVLAVAAHLRREVRITVPTWSDDPTGALHMRPRGVLYFGSVPGLERTFITLLGEHPNATSLVVHLDGLGRIDVTGALALKALLSDARAAGLSAEIADIPPHVKKIVTRVLGPDETS